MKITETIEPKRTTICLLPTLTRTESDNLTADRRSMKAMSACLNGIPIVSSAWIGHCLQRKKVIVPEENMFVRTLPTKSMIGSISEFGVAYQAAHIGHVQGHSLPLGHVKVAYMVGFNNTSNDTTNFCSLLRLAGVNEIVFNPSVASSRMKEFLAQGGTSINISTNSKAIEYYVLICNDDAQAVKYKSFLSDAFLREIHNFSSPPASNPTVLNRRVMVVNLQWLFDSISCSVLLQPDTKSTVKGIASAGLDAQGADYCYRPKNERAIELWQLTK